VSKHLLKTQLFKIFWSTLDWVYPPVCAACGVPGYPLCKNCENEIQFINGKLCSICGGAIRQNGVRCEECEKNPPAFDSARSLAFYGGVIRECIHSLKYGNNRTLGKYFAELLKPIVDREGWIIDAVIPVPLSQERLKERGYNQTAAIAHPLGLFMERSYQPYGLKQVRDTRSQVGLSAGERRLNVIDAFEAVPELVFQKNILLIDDVMTTGATLEACAAALKEAGCGSIYCLTIARFSG
jgi:ComF family protein